jgi:hypothetical protein
VTVLFLDFDGVLNSEGSFVHETRRRKRDRGLGGAVNETLDPVCVSNVMYVLDHYPEMKVVISSAWRQEFDIEWLREKLRFYDFDAERVIDVTPTIGDEMRDAEIQLWLTRHPDTGRFLVFDDNDWGLKRAFPAQFVQTTWETGFTFKHAEQAIFQMMNQKKTVKAQRREAKNAKNIQTG